MTPDLPPPAAPPLADHDALPPGTRFGELEIVRVLGVGGFGIVYLARDHALERHVALKEYMPASLARRGVGPMITVRSGSHAQTYAVGLRSFVNEARLLARFDHPSLVKVYRFWEDNATAYMVMPYLQGRTLRDLRRSLSQAPSEMWIRHLLGSLLSAMEMLHREGVYHRDIAPDNILLPPEGPPILLDFGAARRVISDRTQTLTAILKPNYAPIEQYAEMAQLRQGPWTDIYALGAVAHFLLFGVPPPPATARAVQDELVRLPHRLVQGISPRLLATIGWMLAVRPQHRPQNVEELRAVLEGRAPVPAPPPEAEPASSDMTLPLPGHTDFPPTRKVESLAVSSREPQPGPDDTVIRPAIPNSQPSLAGTATPRDRRSWIRGLAWAGGAAAAAIAAGLLLWPAPSEPTLTAGDSAASAAAREAGSNAPALPETVVSVPAVAPPTPATEVFAEQPPAPAAVVPSAEPVRANAVARPAAPARAVPRVEVSARQPARAPVAEATLPVSLTEPADRIDGASVTAPLPAISQSVEADAPASAREACGKRVFIALWSCMDRECERPRFRDQPECVKVLETKQRRGQ